MHIVVIGNGIAGVTAALRVRERQPDWTITMVSGESDFFFSRPALMYLFMGHLRFDDVKPYEDRYWDAQRIERKRAWITGVDAERRELTTDRGERVPYDKLVVATGAVPNKFGWPGQDLERVQGMVSLQDLESLERSAPELRHAVIVGGGLIGIELAEMLHSRGVGVTILAREPAYWVNAMPEAEARMVGDVIDGAGIELCLECELDEIVDDGKGRACAVITRDGRRIDCQLVGLTAGVRPNLSALEGSEVAVGRGVLVDSSFRSTSHDDVFAVGDCAEIVDPAGERNRIEALWYTGRMHGRVAADAICGDERTYDRGVLFNSAKFVDLEWHTYGRVSPGLGPALVEGEQHLYWEHKGRRHSIRLIHEGGTLIGVNTMGIRFRHRVCERWIAEQRDMGYVLDHLGRANFDPELFRRYEREAAGVLREQLR